MNVDLKSVGMEKGMQYELIITTKDNEGNLNTAPIGVKCKNKDEIFCRIFKGSKTLDNILERKKFKINISSNPIYFTFSTIDTIPLEYFDEEENLIDIDAYGDCELISSKEIKKKNDPVRDDAEAIAFNAKVKKLVINNNCAKAMNRGIHSLIENLVNYTRIDMVDEEKKEYYLDRFLEAKRVISKVGSKKDKESLKILEKKLKEKNYL